MSSSSKKQESNNDEQLQTKAKTIMSSFTSNTAQVFGSVMPQALSSLTTRKYTLPDKTVASQVLMYRQLLHTNAKPGLKLSRPYQATAAQQAVKHMPWWEQGIDETKKMVISYDNLIVRLWLNGAILPYTDLLGGSDETLIDEKGLPPVPHKYWVERLGFQQPDPVTDFRSGGVLSLGMMVHIVESHPNICKRFSPEGDASILPFGLTCINITDMMAKFLMLAKSVDRMDALLSQKPFWRMFGDPNAILVLQELSMSMLCDVVVELQRERALPLTDANRSIHNSLHCEASGNVTVFDFPIILETTEKRVEHDLLGAGPKTVEELREIHAKLVVKYEQAIQEKERKVAATRTAVPTPTPNVLESAGTAAQDVLNKFKAVSPPFMRKQSNVDKSNDDTVGSSRRPTNVVTEEVDFISAPPAPSSAVAPDLLSATNAPTEPTNADQSSTASTETGGWANVTTDETTGEITTSVGEFCIDDDEEDEEDDDSL